MRLSLRELAEAFGVAESTVTIWRHRGLPCVKAGGPGRRAAYDFEAVAVHLWRYNNFRFAGYADPDEVIAEARRKARTIVQARRKQYKEH